MTTSGEPLLAVTDPPEGARLLPAPPPPPPSVSPAVPPPPPGYPPPPPPAPPTPPSALAGTAPAGTTLAVRRVPARAAADSAPKRLRDTAIIESRVSAIATGSAVGTGVAGAVRRRGCTYTRRRRRHLLLHQQRRGRCRRCSRPRHHRRCHRCPHSYRPGNLPAGEAAPPAGRSCSARATCDVEHVRNGEPGQRAVHLGTLACRTSTPTRHDSGASIVEDVNSASAAAATVAAGKR